MRRAAALLVVLLAFVAPPVGCSQTATTVLVRSLERSGKAAFLCLRDRTSNTPGQQLDACFTPGQPYAPDIYLVPHVIALVTQTARGEVAVVDVTAQTVLDADPSVPGFNFLPVGALPTDIAATPGSNASFVGIGDPQRPGIFAIPSSRLPFQVGSKISSLGSWPACSLDAVPTELVVVPDITKSHAGRCAPGSDTTPAPPGYDLGPEQEFFGRLKIIATLPDFGELVVIDAQEVLARPVGSFDPCPIEQTLALGAVLPGAPPGDAGLGASNAEAGGSVLDASTALDGAPADSSTADDAIASDGSGSTSDAAAPADATSGGASVDAATCSGRVTASPPPSVDPHPVSMALADDGRLFVSDDRASVIHVVDVHDPCAIAELPPLLPFSAADPRRAVLTKAIAVSPLTSDKKRFVYAVDYKASGSVMVFDVSSGSTERRPLVRSDPDLSHTPYDPPDRITFTSPVESLTFATHDYPLYTAPNGTVPRGIKCDPTVTDPNSPAFPYLPPAGLTGNVVQLPSRLRGTFVFAALSSGRLAVVDVDDLDAPCRRPAATDDDALGCSGALTALDATHPLTGATDEASCKIVAPHHTRSSQYFINSTSGLQHAPALQGFPLLYDKDGTVLTTDPSRPESAQRPKLLGPSLAMKSVAARAILATVAGSSAVPEDGTNDLTSDPTRARNNWVAFDVRAPHSQFAQTWAATYEGVIPPFNGRTGLLRCLADKPAIDCEGGSDPSAFVLYDASVGFCDQGAQGTEIAESMGLPGGGDIVQILQELPDPADAYWSTVGNVCSRASCESAYGVAASPTSARDLGVDGAFQDRLVLTSNPNRGNRTPLACCFPYPVTYTVRAGRHWVVTSSAIGYAHHEIPDPTAPVLSKARCILSCDPALELRNSRVVGIDPFTPSAGKPLPKFDDRSIFRTPQLQFVIWNPAMPPNACPDQPSCPLIRDMSFQFTQTGGFTPLEVPLAQTAVLAQSIRFVRGIDQLAIPDAASQGLLLFDLNVLSTAGVRAFY